MSGGPDTPRAARALPRSGSARVSVITVVRNAAATLERTIQSVLAQTHPELDYHIIDGASTDGTLELIRRYQDRLRWISEPDRGLYDAMNKGLGILRDRDAYVVFLNADDAFHAGDTVERVLGASDGEDLVYGQLERYDEALDYRDVIGKEVDARDMVFGMRCHHQAMFCRGHVFDRAGGFELRYPLAADYDWALRVFRRRDVTKRFVPVVVATMRRGGVSDRRYLRSVRERWQIVRRQCSPADLMRYSLWTGVGDYLRYFAQQALRRLGLLNPARDLWRRRRGAGHPSR